MAKKIIYQASAKAAEKILPLLEEKSVVSFDVFDTLLKRDVSAPEDVFALMEQQLRKGGRPSAEGFSELRKEAEKRAKQVCADREITLKDIYAQMPFDNAARLELMNTECQMELELSVPNLPVQQVYRTCLKQGKKILFLSDMYLSAETVRVLLEKNGYSEGALYISSESGFTKSSGRLFSYVQERESIDKSQWLHIGDNILSDQMVPRRMGIRSVLIERDTHNNKYFDKKLYRKNADYRQLNHFIDTHISRYTDSYEQIGYAVLGPLLYGFSCWLARMIPKDETIVFLAREGTLLQQAFEIVSSRPSAFLYISRRAANLAKLAVVQNSDEVSQFKILTLHREPKAMELANHFGLSDQEAKEILKKNQIDENTKITNIEIEKQVWDAIWTAAKAKGIEQHSLLQAYFEQLGLSDNCALVDVGWHGTMQVLLNASHYRIAGTSICWSGYYLGALEEGPDSEYSSIVKHGFLFEKDAPRKIENVMRYTAPFLELLFLATIGSTVGYKRAEDGSVLPVLGEPENLGGINTVIERLQSAGLQFVKDISASLVGKDLFDREVSCGNYLALAEVPSSRTLSLFSDFNTEDGCLHKLISEHTAGYYMLHPKRFLADFKQMPGKAWFLKSIFKVPLSYIPVISFARKVFSNE